jgi:hypothetical protein
MPRKDFEAFSRLDASDVNTYLMDQAVQTFASSAARGSAIGTATEGMVSYLDDINSVELYNGSGWVNASNTGRGLVSFNETVTGTTIVAATPLDIMSSTFTIFPGRRYNFFGRVTYQLGNTNTVRVLYIQNSDIGNVALHYVTSGIPSANLNDTQLGSVSLTSAELGVTTGSGTSKTVNLRFYTGASGVVSTNPDTVLGSNSSRPQLIVTDLGAA